MAEKRSLSRVQIYFLATRPAFLTAAAAPVLAGSALGFAAGGTFDIVYFLLALFGMMFLQAGSNAANDYYDHLSGDDPANKNPSRFSGGSRFIQKGFLSPAAALLEGVILLAAGGLLGIVILVLTHSVFILVLGIAGLLGGFFYTAPPCKFSYHTLGELVIAFLFGILPVAGSYFLQTGKVDWSVLPAGIIVGLLIFEIILINEFPDYEPDASVGKKTIVVRFGIRGGAAVYRAALVLTYMTAALSLFVYDVMFYASIAYLLTLPLGIKILRLVRHDRLKNPADVWANALTVRIHVLGSTALTLGFVISGFAANHP